MFRRGSPAHPGIGHAHDAAHGLDDGVVGRIGGERPGLAEAGGGGVDQARIDLGEFVI